MLNIETRQPAIPASSTSARLPLRAKLVVAIALTVLLSATGTARAQAWGGYGGDAQHSGLSAATAQRPLHIRWSSPIDLLPQYSGSDLLIHDSQYTDAEYVPRIGWGHSSMRQAIEFAARAGVGRLAAFHHDPTHHDEALDEMYQAIIGEMKPRFPVIPAKEGDVIEVLKS